MKNKSIKICDVTVHPGEMANLALPLPEEYSCAPLYMPIKVIHGTKKGPCLLIFSVLKGNELNGLEIANRISQSTNPSDISGTLICIPVVNVYGLTHNPSILPSGGYLSNCFPGNERGNYGERIAHLFTHEILKKADYSIELQTGGPNHNILPQTYCNFDNKTGKQLAKAFKTPVVTNATIEGNPLRKTMEELNIPFVIYQAGEAMRFDENAIMLGVEGVKNVMTTINMLSKKDTHGIEITPTFSRDEDWIIAHRGGILHPNIELGQTIKQNECIGMITDPFGAEAAEPIKSPQEGIVVGINTSPLVHEGLPVFKIASFLDYEKAESAIEEWDKRQPDSYMTS